ncbi:hypothetical protein ABH944_003066 [Caballeronia udeis]|uniref:Uncharacterized protein n=1 Tax=Caballeronia udeis TaxID=1232866 RepID=A0ABW8MHI2_9BURK
MKTVTLGVASREAVNKRFLAAFEGASDAPDEPEDPTDHGLSFEIFWPWIPTPAISPC